MGASSPQDGTLPSEKEENPELLKFREEWLAELQQRKGASKVEVVRPNLQTPGTVAHGGLTSQYPLGSNHVERATEISTSSALASGSSVQTPAYLATHPALGKGEIKRPSHSSTTLERALNIYRRAVEHEQKSDLDEALLLYRQAFRLADNVDRAYHQEEMLKSALKAQKMSEVPQPPSEVDKLSANLKEAAIITSPGTAAPTTLAGLVESFLQDRSRFEPENEMEPVVLNILPEELLVDILRNLDPTSLERFARVCKKARVISLDSGIWRQLVRKTYQPPQVTDYDMIINVIEKYNWDFRRVFIEQPRLRLDGVYIANCFYVRHGLGENAWVNPSHLITYHRYLRFYSNGQVLSLLANEEYSPRQIIPILKPTLRMNGLLLGQWRLAGNRVHLTNLIESKFLPPVSASAGPGPPPDLYPSSSVSPGSERTETARYTFLMTLNLRSRPLGSWNRMVIEGYESINGENGDVSPIILKHERPFWFSKVRSYSSS